MFGTTTHLLALLSVSKSFLVVQAGGLSSYFANTLGDIQDGHIAESAYDLKYLHCLCSRGPSSILYPAITPHIIKQNLQ